MSILRKILQLDIVSSLSVTWRYFIRSKFTLQYPEEKKTRADRFRGMPVLLKDQNGKEKCIGCKRCEKICPATAISIATGENGKRIAVRSFYLNTFLCISCGLCKQVCPVGAIKLTKNMPNMVGVETNIYAKEQLLEIGENQE